MIDFGSLLPVLHAFALRHGVSSFFSFLTFLQFCLLGRCTKCLERRPSNCTWAVAQISRRAIVLHTFHMLPTSKISVSATLLQLLPNQLYASCTRGLHASATKVVLQDFTQKTVVVIFTLCVVRTSREGPKRGTGPSDQSERARGIGGSTSPPSSTPSPWPAASHGVRSAPLDLSVYVRANDDASARTQWLPWTPSGAGREGRGGGGPESMRSAPKLRECDASTPLSTLHRRTMGDDT